MLKVLLKKQLTESFRSYFYDAKRNKAKSKGSIVFSFVLFAVLIVGVLGGTFAFMSFGICLPFVESGVSWMYFTIMTLIAVFMGAFGSVFNTYSALYLSKDNDLLLSMPIPLKYIIASKLLSVYLLGAMYSAVVIVPAILIYFVFAGISVARLVCCILLFLMITLVVLVLSCLLGFCVAKVSQKIKNKSFVTVAFSLVLIAGYYYLYFKAQDLLAGLVANAAIYGDKIKGAAYGLYLLGQIGTGDLLATLIYAAATALVVFLTWLILKGTFLSIATSSGNTDSVKYKAKTVKQKSAFSAILKKEFLRFTGSANYMLNAGLGTLLIPVLGIILLVKGSYFADVLSSVFTAVTDCIPVLLLGAIILASTMNDMAAPSVSLEGKNIWILQSLPIDAKSVIKAKKALQIILTAIPVLFTVICGSAVIDTSVWMKILICVTAVLFTFFSTNLALYCGLKMPNLTWTNEVIPIKQSGAVLVSIFGGWGIAIAFVGIYMLIGYEIGALLYVSLFAVLLLIATVLLSVWNNTKGAKIFAEL